MNRRIWIPITMALSLAALPRVAAGQEQEQAGERAHACPAGAECPMGEDHAAMMARHQAMMQQQHEEASARMQELQDRMHQATGDAKVDAIAALLDAMLAQHRAMHELMMGQHPMMMHDDDMKHERMEEEDSRP